MNTKTDRSKYLLAAVIFVAVLSATIYDYVQQGAVLDQIIDTQNQRIVLIRVHGLQIEDHHSLVLITDALARSERFRRRQGGCITYTPMEVMLEDKKIILGVSQQQFQNGLVLQLDPDYLSPCLEGSLILNRYLNAAITSALAQP